MLLRALFLLLATLVRLLRFHLLLLLLQVRLTLLLLRGPDLLLHLLLLVTALVQQE